MNLNFGYVKLVGSVFHILGKLHVPGYQEVALLVHKYRCSYYICIVYRIVVRHVVVVVIILIEYKSVP